MGGRRRLAYGVIGGEVEGFCEADKFVSEFLVRYKEHPRTWWAYAASLFMFFRWLEIRKGLKVSGKELLNLHIKHRSSNRVEDRRWTVGLALEFSRDNPDLKECSEGRKYQMFNVVKQFFDCYEAPLTSGKNVYAKKIRRKFKPRQISVQDACRILGFFNVRDRAILLVMLQSGMSIGDVLNKFNLMLPQLKTAIKNRVSRFKIEFDERKGNGFNYFTFISVDALHELEKWLALRAHWLDGKKDSGTVFVAKPIAVNGEECKAGRPLTVLSFEVNFNRVVRNVKLKDGPWSVTPHMFRKLFKTESRPPERGVDQDCVEFMLGHSSGIQAVGGIYDKTPELHADVVEREYAKLEPYLNVYTGVHADSEEQRLKEELFKNLTPDVIEWILEQVKKTKQTL